MAKSLGAMQREARNYPLYLNVVLSWVLCVFHLHWYLTGQRGKGWLANIPNLLFLAAFLITFLVVDVVPTWASVLTGMFGAIAGVWMFLDGLIISPFVIIGHRNKLVQEAQQYADLASERMRAGKEAAREARSVAAREKYGY